MGPDKQVWIFEKIQVIVVQLIEVWLYFFGSNIKVSSTV